MEKIISILVLMLFMMSISVIAAPPPPYILYGHVEWNSQMLSGSKLDITVNGVTNTIVTDGGGYWIYQVLSYSVGDENGIGATIITLKVLDGCGTGDLCIKSVTVGAEGTKDYAQVDFSITGTLSCPPANCPSCGGSGGCYYRESICNDKFPPKDCESDTCPVPSYTEANCNALFPCDEVLPPVCDEPIVCSDVEDEECPENTGLSGLLTGIAAFILTMGGGIQIYKNRKGGITMLHRHRGILGYHDVNRGHRNPLYDHEGLTENPIQYAKDLKRINA